MGRRTESYRMGGMIHAHDRWLSKDDIEFNPISNVTAKRVSKSSERT
jgi:hypothetical protein